MTRRSLVPALVLVLAAARVAAADTGSWQGYQTLGVPDEQVAVLGGITIEGLQQGGLLADVILDDAAGRCATDVACHCGVARKRGVRYAAFGSLGRLGDLWTVELTLIDAHNCTVESVTEMSEPIADALLPARIIALARRLSTPATNVTSTVVGGERTIDATPALVTTFTRSQLRALHIRNLDDLLPLVPGFEVVDANWGGLVLNEGLANTLLVLSDGIPLVNATTNFRWLDRDYRSSLAHVARVEIVRGPGAVVWGRNAFLGVINLISEPPIRREPSVEAGVSVGTLNTEEAWARASQNRGSYGFSGSIDVGRRVGPVTEVPDSPQTSLGVSPIVYGNGGTTSPRADLWFDVLLRLAFAKRFDAIFQNQTSEVQFEISPRGPLLDPDQGGYWQKTHRLYALIGTQPIYENPCTHVALRGQLSRYEFYTWENFAVQPLWPQGPAPADPTMRDYRLGLRSLQGNRDPRVANQLDLRVLSDYEGYYTSHFTGGVGWLDLRAPDSIATLTGIIEEPTMQTVSYTKKTNESLSMFAVEELVPLPGFGVSAGARVQLDGTEDGSGNRNWRAIANAQGGLVYEHHPFGAKLVYAQGFRPPDGNSLYSTVGTKGNPDLVPERSQDLASEAHMQVLPELTVRAGGNLTRISKLIVLVPIFPPSTTFAYEPQNRGRIDLAGVFVQAELATGKNIDAFATYHATWLRESDPLVPAGTSCSPTERTPYCGIPLAQHTASFGAVWRLMTDLTVFARGTFASPRRLHVMTAADPAAPFKTDPTIRTTLGVSLANAIGPFDVDLAVDNPLLLSHDAPYQVDGAIAGLVERRDYTEVFATVRYER